MTVDLNPVETLLAIAEIATALAGFSGVVVVFGSRSQGSWQAGDRMRLSFLLEASLAAGGFALLTLLLLNTTSDEGLAWTTTGAIWVLYMVYSLASSHQRIRRNLESHDDVDRVANRLVTGLFVILMVLQVANALLWQAFAPLLAALTLNLAGAAMQFTRLIRSAFHD